MDVVNDAKSPEEDDEDLLRLTDDDDNGTTADIDTDNLDILKEIDSYCESSDGHDEGDETVLLAAVEKEEGKSDDETALLTEDSGKEKEKCIDTNTSINFKPPASSTPHRPSTSNFVSSLTPLAPIVEEEEEDYSILYEGLEGEEEDQEYQTLHLDQLNENLDFSLLYSDEEGEDESNDATIKEENNVEHSDLLESDGKKSELTAKKAVKKNEPIKNEIASSKKKPGGQNKEDSNIFLRKSIWKVREEYYKKAVKLWKMTSKTIPNVGDRKLRMPLIYKDKNGKIIGGESPEEWADKHHPKWEEYHRMSLEQYGAFIHHKWNWNTSIDLTRNLTKFGQRSVPSQQQKRNQRLGGDRKDKKSRDYRNLAAETDYVVEAIDQNAIIDVLLNKVGCDESNDRYGREEVSSSSSRLAQDVITSNCKFCTVICHCSPGRRLKRPYEGEAFDEPTVKSEKLLRLENVHEEIRDGLNCHVANFSTMSNADNKRVYSQVGVNVIASTNEAFELFNNYRKSNTDVPNFTREQVRELLSVELTQDKFTHVYRNPYATGNDSEEEVSDDDDDDEKDTNEENAKEDWSQSKLENY